MKNTKRDFCFALLTVFGLAMPISSLAQDDGFWRQLGRGLKETVPTVQINSPIPLPHSNKWKSAVATQNASQVPQLDKQQPDALQTFESGVDTENATTNYELRTSNSPNELPLIPPGKKGGELPSLKNVVVAVTFESATSNFVQAEIGKKAQDKGAFVVPVTQTGNACIRQNQPIICIVVHDPIQIGNEQKSDSGSNANYGGNNSYNSSGSNSEDATLYAVGVEALLYMNDASGEMKPIGLAAKTFHLPKSSSNYGSGSGSNQRGGYYDSGGSSSQITYTNERQVVLAIAENHAIDAAKELFGKKGDWYPGAAQAVVLATNKSLPRR